MGCWNATCYISKLPIHDGEPVVMIAVRKSTGGREDNHTCCPSDAYSPFGYPIYGKYNDYGGITDIENKDEVIDYFHSLRDPGFANLTEDKLERTLDDILYDGDVKFGRLRLDAFFVKRDLYDLLVKDAADRSIYGKNETIGHQTKRLIYKGVEEVRRRHERYKNAGCLIDIMESIEVSRTMRYFEVSDFGDFSSDITMYLKKKIVKDAKEEDVDKLVEILMFQRALRSLRMGYFSLSGNGSQSEEMFAHTLVAKYVLDQADRAYNKHLQSGDKNMSKKEFLSEPCYGYYEKPEEVEEAETSVDISL